MGWGMDFLVFLYANVSIQVKNWSNKLKAARDLDHGLAIFVPTNIITTGVFAMIWFINE